MTFKNVFSACLERGCEHHCEPPETEDGVATCECLEGYMLNEDGVSCDGEQYCLKANVDLKRHNATLLSCSVLVMTLYFFQRSPDGKALKEFEGNFKKSHLKVQKKKRNSRSFVLQMPKNLWA